MERLFVLAWFCSLPRVIGTGAEMKQVKGVVGKSVWLLSGNSADLHGREVVWEFTSNNGTEFPILDVGPNHPGVKPNKHFEDRLHFKQSTGDLLLSNLRTSDQGSYTISVDGRQLRIIHLQIFEMNQVNGVVGKSVLLLSGNSADLHSREIVWEFTSNNGTEFTILDVGPNHPEVKPNKYFEDCLNLNLSTGDLLLSNLRTSDQGNYTITVDGWGLRIIDLRVFAEMKQVKGVVGKSVLLLSGNSADLHGREVVWEFTSNNGTEFTILDIGPNHPEVKPNKYFEDRLHFKRSTGDLLLSNLRTTDQGIYTISIDGRELRKIRLRIFGHPADDTVMTALSISALVFSSLYLIAVFPLNIWKIKSEEESPKLKWWTRILYACNILQFVFILVAFTYTTHFKASDFLNVATGCIAFLLFFTLTLPYITRRSNCQRISRFSINTVIWNFIQCALHAIMIGISIAFLVKDIHQKEQGRVLHSWNVLIASAVECTVSFLLALMFNSSFHSRICLWIRKEHSRMTGRNKINVNEKGPQNAEELQIFRTCHTEDTGTLHPN